MPQKVLKITELEKVQEFLDQGFAVITMLTADVVLLGVPQHAPVQQGE